MGQVGYSNPDDMQSPRPFEAVGVSEVEEDVYHGLLQHPGCSVADLARLLSTSQQRIRAVLESLEGKGLVKRSTDRLPRFMPARPDVAIDVLILRHQEQLQQARLSAAELLERLHSTVVYRGHADLVEVITGRGIIAHQFEQLQRMAQQELWLFDKPPYVAEGPNPVEVELLQRGVAYHCIYEEPALQRPGQLEQIGLAVDSGELARIVPSLPMKLAIADRSLALVPLGTGDAGVEGGVLIHASPILEALRTLFEILWERGTPIRRSRSISDGPAGAAMKSSLSREEEKVLEMLAAGLTDESISVQLNAGRRTVQRRIRRIMDVFGVDTRFQMGLIAAEQGWLEASAPGATTADRLTDPAGSRRSGSSRTSSGP